MLYNYKAASRSTMTHLVDNCYDVTLLQVQLVFGNSCVVEHHLTTFSHCGESKMYTVNSTALTLWQTEKQLTGLCIDWRFCGWMWKHKLLLIWYEALREVSLRIDCSFTEDCICIVLKPVCVSLSLSKIDQLWYKCYSILLSKTTSRTRQTAFKY